MNRIKTLLVMAFAAIVSLSNLNAQSYPQDITGSINHYRKEHKETVKNEIRNGGTLLSSLTQTKTYKDIVLEGYWQQIEVGVEDSNIVITGTEYSWHRDVCIVYAKEAFGGGTDWMCRFYSYQDSVPQHPRGGWVYTGWTAVSERRDMVGLSSSHGKIGKVETWGTTSSGLSTYTKETGVAKWCFDLRGESLSWDEWVEAWRGSTLVDNESLNPGTIDYATLGDSGLGGLYSYTLKILREPK
jgi:hypothetical protein